MNQPPTSEARTPAQAASDGLSLAELVTRRMRADVTRLSSGQTVGEALEWLRRHPPPGRIIYFYVVDGAGRLEGVVPTRRLVLSPPGQPVSEIMIRNVVALPAGATVLDACEFFIHHRLLGFPVVDAERRLLGAVDIELYTDVLNRLEEETPARRLVAPLVRFLRVESSSGVLLLACAVLALILTNSPWSGAFEALWQTPLGLTVGGWGLTKPLLLWINDGLMTIFFFLAGLEIKRELVDGELSDPRKAALPVVAALGGMVAPACVYLLFQWGQPTASGWGVPMATDIAFVVGVLTLLGPRVPAGLKILLLSLAIADDLGAALVIALAYSSGLSLPILGWGVAGFGLVLLFRRLGVRWLGAYVVLGAGIWLAFLKSGVHPTVAGAALGLLTPARPWPGYRAPLDAVTETFGRLAGAAEGAPAERLSKVSLLERLEHGLHPWVAFGIMPLFALANAGVAARPGDLVQPVALAVAAGLVVGKPVGIVLASWLAVKMGLARLPNGVSWKVLMGAGCLAGIGFTMSLFIAGLALGGSSLEQAKVGVLAGSTVSAAVGSLLLLRYLLPRSPTHNN